MQVWGASFTYYMDVLAMFTFQEKNTHMTSTKKVHTKKQNINQRLCTLKCLWKQEKNYEIRMFTKTRKQLPMTFIY